MHKNNNHYIKSKLKKKEIDKYFVFTLFLAIFHLILNILWLFLDNTPPGWDDSIHIIKTIEYAHYFKENFFEFNLIKFLKISNYYPITTYLVGVPLALISNNNYKIIQFTGTIFLIISLLGLYFFAKFNFKSSKIAFVATFLFSFFITIQETSKDQMLDLPLTANILITLCFLEKFISTWNWRYFYLFILGFAVSQNTKWYAFVYLTLPCLFSLVRILRKNFFDKVKDSYYHFLIGCITFFLMVLPWYLVNFSVIKNYGGFALRGEKTNWSNIFSSSTVFYYLKLITIFEIHFIGLILLLFSIFLLINSSISNKEKILATLVFNYIFFTLIPNKNIRYTIPLMPFVALVMAYGFGRLILTKNKLASLFASFLIIYYVFAYFILFFGIPIYPKYKQAIRFPLIGWVDIFYLADYPVRYIYEKKIWPQNFIVKEISSLSSTSKNSNILVNIDRLHFNASNLTLFALLSKKTSLKFSCPYILMKEIKNETEMMNFLNKFDFILVPQNKVIGEDTNFISYEPLKRFQQFILSNKLINFKRINFYFLPSSNSFINDKDIIWLYQKINY